MSEQNHKQVFIVGCGIGQKSLLTRQAAAALKAADLWVGNSELLDAFRETELGKNHRFLEESHAEFFADVVREAEEEKIALLIPGDPGFSDTAQSVYESISRYRPVILPGISVISYFASRCGISVRHAVIFDAKEDCGGILPALMRHRSVLILNAGRQLLKSLASVTMNVCQVYAAEQLGGEHEKIYRGNLEELADRVYSSELTIYITRIDRRGIPLAGIPDTEFDRGTLPMTKSEVRAVVMSRLMLEEDDIVYDIGSGTGSVSVEMGLMVPYGAVYAIEQHEEGKELLEKNAAKYGLGNIHPVTGRAPEALASLPAPDVVFIGGSSGTLKDLIQIVHSRNPKVRIVLTAVTIETTAQAVDLMESYGMNPEILTLQVSRSRKAGGKHLMAAQNPVTIISGGGVAPEGGVG